MIRAIKERLNVMFPRAKGPTEQYERLKQLSGVGEETIRKIMSGESSPTLKNITAIANAVSLSLSQLFDTTPRSRRSAEVKESDTSADELQRR